MTLEYLSLVMLLMASLSAGQTPAEIEQVLSEPRPVELNPSVPLLG